MSRGGIDYSKWDHFGEDDSSEEEDAAAPRVTRLDQPSRVTLQRDGDLLVEQAAGTTTKDKSQAAAKVEDTEAKDKSDVASTSQQQTVAKEGAESVPSLWTDKGSQLVVLPNKTQLYWRQDRTSVELRFVLPGETRKNKWQVRVEGMLPFSQRHAAVGGTKPHLTISCDGTVWFQDDLPHPVHAAEEEGGDDSTIDNGTTSVPSDRVDWSIETWQEERILLVSLYKATPMEGMTLWWKQPTASLPEIELDWMEDSKSGGDFATVWKEAHEQFRQKLADSKQQQQQQSGAL